MVRLLALARKCNFPSDLASRRLIERCVEHPTVKTWSAAYGITLGSIGHTVMSLWQAVLLTDPSFPAHTTEEQKNGHIKWTRVPSQLLLIRAVTRATLQRQPPESEGVNHGH